MVVDVTVNPSRSAGTTAGMCSGRRSPGGVGRGRRRASPSVSRACAATRLAGSQRSHCNVTPSCFHGRPALTLKRRMNCFGTTMHSRKRLLQIFLVAALFTLGTTGHDVSEAETNSTRGFLSSFFRKKEVKPVGICDCTCGLKNEDSRIVGGQTTLVNEFPWQVRLSYMNKFYCGGTLINDRYVLTAAHCVRGFMWFMIKVTVGEHDRCSDKAQPDSRFVTRAIIGNFSFLNFDHDIALLRLNDQVFFGESVRPVCLPKSKEKLYEKQTGIATGWGTLHEDGKATCLLQSVEVPVMSPQECRNTSYNPRMISDNMMCAGYVEGKKDTCQGDSGGPLVAERQDKRYEVIGVVSWGNGCARPGYPGVYTRVTRYLDWIRENTKDGCVCEKD